MKIGIDISQLVYQNTGVSSYLKNLVNHLLRIDRENSYVLFGSSFRRRQTLKKIVQEFNDSNHRTKPVIKLFWFPPTILDFLWNKLHIFPVEWFIGDIDVFISSDWTQPQTKKAKKATILYDLIVYKYPEETDKKIVETQKRKLKWVKKEAEVIFCISESTKKDATEILGIEKSRLTVIYPGL